MARSATQYAPNTLPPYGANQDTSQGIFGMPNTAIPVQAYNQYQNAQNQIIQNANQAASRGFTQNHPILSGILSGLAGAAIAGPVGAIAGPMLTQYGNKARKSAIYNTAQDQIDSLTTQYKEVDNPLAQLSQGNRNLNAIAPLFGATQQNAAEYGRGNSALGAAFEKPDNSALKGLSQNEPPLALMDYSMGDGGELPAFSEPSGQALQANATSTQMPRMMSYQPDAVDYSGLDNVYMTPEQANSVLGNLAILRNNGMTEGRQQMLAPSQEQQNLGAANSSNAAAYKATQEGRMVVPKAQAWIDNENAGTVLKRAQTQWYPKVAQAQISNYNERPVGTQPSESSLRLMLANALKSGDKKTVDALTAALSAGKNQGFDSPFAGLTGEMPASPAALNKPPAAAIAKLKENPTPELIRFFNAKYGAGTAQRVLK